MTLTNDTVENNSAGDIQIASGTVYIDAFTLANTIDNGGTIEGPYIET